MSLLPGSERVRHCIVGLGNPGAEYVDTRHNLGFSVVDRLVARVPTDQWHQAEFCGSEVALGNGLLLAKPMTYMNRSGYAARCLADELELEPDRLLIVYDEIDLPLGRMRVRGRGGPAGHKGMASVLTSLETDRVPRLRLGIGRQPEQDVVSFVLGSFETGEHEEVAGMIERAADACELWVSSGMTAAMQEFN